MTAQEQQMLQGLTDRINQTQLPEKDMDAERMLQQALNSNPDALYILAQTVLVQQYALEQARKQLAEQKTQMEQMKQQASAPPPQKHATSFLGNLLGLKDDEPARPAPPPPAAPAYAQVPYTPAPGYASTPGYAPGYAPGSGAPMYAQPGYGTAPQGGFLRSAMQTAAGVAAGALAFEGVESLMHGFGHAAGYGSEFGSGMGGGFGGAGFGGGGRPEEVINNYYGDAVPGAEHGLHTDQSDFLSSGSGLSGIGSGLGTGSSETSHLDSSSAFSSPTFKDADYRPGQDSGSNLSAGGYDAGAGYTDPSSSDTGATEDSAVDDSSVDDSASFDDSSSADSDFDSGGDSGGGFDSGGGDDSGGNF